MYVNSIDELFDELESKQLTDVVGMLIGLPCSGKSTFVKKHFSNWPIISTDTLIENECAKYGKKYDDGFKFFYDWAEGVAKASFTYWINHECPVIIDRTNMSKKSRNKWLSQLPKSYKKFAIVFETSNELIAERMNNPDRTKIVPWNVIEYMRKQYQEPTLDEFDYILKIVQ